jgi:DNA-binding response OmpR family regulator
MATILIVDKEAAIRMLYEEEFTEEGYDVDTISTIQEAMNHG